MLETIIVLLECKPVTAYRAVFDDFDDVTGLPITGTWHATREEVITEFAEHGFKSIESADMRIHELERLLQDCKIAYRKDGSAGVSGVLAQRTLDRARSECNLAEAELDHSRELAGELEQPPSATSVSQSDLTAIKHDCGHVVEHYVSSWPRSAAPHEIAGQLSREACWSCWNNIEPSTDAATK